MILVVYRFIIVKFITAATVSRCCSIGKIQYNIVYLVQGDTKLMQANSFNALRLEGERWTAVRRLIAIAPLQNLKFYVEYICMSPLQTVRHAQHLSPCEPHLC